MPSDGKLPPDEKAAGLAVVFRFRCRMGSFLLRQPKNPTETGIRTPPVVKGMRNMKRKNEVSTMVICALLIAIQIILSRFLSISTPVVKIGFDFAPMALAGMLFGPWWGCAVGVLADFAGANLFPIGPYFPGFTLVAGLSGMTYGLLLHSRNGSFLGGRASRVRLLLAVLIVTIPLQMGLDTLWMTILYGNGYLYYLGERAVKACVMIPVQIVTIPVLANMLRPVWKRMENRA